MDKSQEDRIKTSIDFWKKMTSKRNYDEKGYDFETTHYIKEQLSLPHSKSILQGLNSKKIELEEFIKIFFEATQPFSNMMSELLNMFEEIEAKKTNKNLNILFNFNKGKEPFKINLKNFRKYVNSLVNVKKEYHIPNLTTDELFKMLHIISCQEIYRANTISDEWIESYNSGILLDTLPVIKTPDPDFNELIHIVLLVLKDIIERIKAYNVPLNELSSFKHSDNLELSKLARLVSDKWVINTYKALNDISRCESIKNDLASFFEDVDLTKKITINEKVEILEEILELPFWDKRYELYSVWVFTQIYKATKNYGLKVHTKNNTLAFPFKETHLATLNCENNNNIMIYSEKRTKLQNPVGKGRNKSIQPDYSFYIEPTDDIDSSILEIECKQYKRTSTDSFARTLIDYSNGRPNADVYIVNYGKMNTKNIFNRIDKITKENSIDNNSNRCNLISELKPGSNEVSLIKIIQKKISNHFCIDKDFLFTDTFHVELYWQQPLVDLDLHLEFTNRTGQITEINYKNKKFEDIFLNKDVQIGSKEPEIIKVNNIKKGIYKFCVHNYLGKYFDSNVVFKIIAKNNIIKELHPSKINGNYWEVVEIDTINNKFKIIDKTTILLVPYHHDMECILNI